MKTQIASIPPHVNRGIHEPLGAAAAPIAVNSDHELGEKKLLHKQALRVPLIIQQPAEENGNLVLTLRIIFGRHLHRSLYPRPSVIPFACPDVIILLSLVIAIGLVGVLG